MKLKVCGMRSPENIERIAALNPDYMGFIFWSKSPRFIGKDFDPIHLNLLGAETKTVGVFVDEFIPRLVEAVDYYHLDVVQLHGKESPEYCKKLRAQLDGVEIIKAIHVESEDSLSTPSIESISQHVDYLLFDTKGHAPGGNGVPFDWKALENVSLPLPYFLSGGIETAMLPQVLELHQKSPKLYATDINSRFETEPGVKSENLVSEFFSVARR